MEDRFEKNDYEDKENKNITSASGSNICPEFNEKNSMVHEAPHDIIFIGNSPKLPEIKRGKLKGKMSTVRKLVLS
ncbi:unnamed protein product [Rotaria sp. Silwood1]|nr:unnamed protein product [Rotaria sp. Silwood1]CAF1636263.1 unnamed protein product [Rotaria sp. Silwood1]CAF3802887.1 unnamed protein product [Rotaria sp. Silwood1]CAF3864845.1 unnamed protein product [Rotaria sp. Silwood1]CAF4897979.1 unnamed protein product [Rotaria sp. Silwood1]